VINAALLEGEFQKDIKVALLPNTYALHGLEPENPKDCVLYHATSGGQTVKDKAQTLVNVHTAIKRKMINEV